MKIYAGRETSIPVSLNNRQEKGEKNSNDRHKVSVSYKMR